MKEIKKLRIRLLIICRRLLPLPRATFLSWIPPGAQSTDVENFCQLLSSSPGIGRDILLRRVHISRAFFIARAVQDIRDANLSWNTVYTQRHALNSYTWGTAAPATLQQKTVMEFESLLQETINDLRTLGHDRERIGLENFLQRYNGLGKRVFPTKVRNDATLARVSSITGKTTIVKPSSFFDYLWPWLLPYPAAIMIREGNYQDVASVPIKLAREATADQRAGCVNLIATIAAVMGKNMPTEEYFHEIWNAERTDDAFKVFVTCMKPNSKALELYRNNPGKVRYFIVNSKIGQKGKGIPVARALLWSLDNGETLLDRIYPVNNGKHILYAKNVAKKEGWYYRESGVAGQRQLKQHGNNVEKRLEATINTGSYPYMDTLYMGFKTAKGKKLVISNDPHAGARHDKKFVMQFTNQHNENHFKEMTLEKCHCCGDGLYREIVKHRGPDSAYLCLPCFTTELVVPVLSTVQQYKKDCVFSKFYNGFVLKTQLVTVDTGECAGKELHSYDIIKLDNKTYSIRELGNFAAEQGLEESYEILAQKFRKHLKV